MPNPFMSSFSVAVTFNQPGKAFIRIIDMYGKTVKTLDCTVTSGSNIIRMDNLQSLASGSYIVEVRNEKEVVFGKIFKIQ